MWSLSQKWMAGFRTKKKITQSNSLAVNFENSEAKTFDYLNMCRKKIFALI